MTTHDNGKAPEAAERYPVVPMKPVGPINDIDTARKFLIRYMAANFEDRTFMRYIRDELAGDFAFQLASVLSASEMKAAPAQQDFDTWMANPYTKVLQKSIEEDYVPRSTVQAAPVQGQAHSRFGSLAMQAMILQNLIKKAAPAVPDDVIETLRLIRDDLKTVDDMRHVARETLELYESRAAAPSGLCPKKAEAP